MSQSNQCAAAARAALQRDGPVPGDALHALPRRNERARLGGAASRRCDRAL